MPFITDQASCPEQRMGIVDPGAGVYAARAEAKPRQRAAENGSRTTIQLRQIIAYFFNPAVQFNTTVKGTDAVGPTGVMRRNRFPSAVTSPTIVPEGV